MLLISIKKRGCGIFKSSSNNMPFHLSLLRIMGNFYVQIVVTVMDYEQIKTGLIKTTECDRVGCFSPRYNETEKRNNF